jgi:hypothetical protein
MGSKQWAINSGQWIVGSACGQWTVTMGTQRAADSKQRTFNNGQLTLTVGKRKWTMDSGWTVDSGKTIDNGWTIDSGQ